MMRDDTGAPNSKIWIFNKDLDLYPKSKNSAKIMHLCSFGLSVKKNQIFIT